MTYLVLFLLALAAMWWWTSQAEITVPRVPEVSDRIPFPGGLRVHDPEHAIMQIERRDEIVIPHEHALLVIAFPLTTPVTLAVSAPIPHGFTRAELVRTICNEYENVYDIEEATATIKPLPEAERKRIGRNRTDGMYGIWGHDLDELVLTAVHWTCTPDSKVTIQPKVEPRPRPELPA